MSLSVVEAVADDLDRSLKAYIHDLDGVDPRELIGAILDVVNDFVTDVPVVTIRVTIWGDTTTTEVFE